MWNCFKFGDGLRRWGWRGNGQRGARKGSSRQMGGAFGFDHAGSGELVEGC